MLASPQATSSGVLLLTATLAVSACGDESASSEVRIDTVAGIPHVTTTGPGVWSEEERWTVGDRTLRLGTVEGEGPEAFGSVASLTVGPESRVFVADGQTMEVRVFGPDGEFLRSLGGQGEGPGEFRAQDGVELGPDGMLYVRDPRLSRVSRFDPETGEFLGSFQLERGFILYSDGTTLWTDGEGRLWDQVLLNLNIGEADRYALVRYPAGGGSPDTLIVGEHASPRVLAVDAQGTPRAGLGIPFSADAVLDVGPRGRIAWGVGDTYTITLRGPEGDTLRAFGRPLEAEPVTASEAGQARVSLRERAREVSDQVARLEDYELPETKPLFEGIVADRTGHWWVRRFRWLLRDAGGGEGETRDPASLPPLRHDVFDPEGRFLGTVETPVMRIMEIGRDFVAGVEEDELGVPYVAVYALVKP